jgi:hypothetical protein
MVANIPFIFWCGAFLWAIYAMLDTLGLARPLTRWITGHVWLGITAPIRKYPILFAVLGYVGGLGVLVWASYEPIALFDNATITGWEDRRSLGLGFAGIVAPLLAIIGFILSANRTRMMEQDSHIKEQEAKRLVFKEKIDALDEGGSTAMAAIFHIEQTGLTDKTYGNEAVYVLTQFVRNKTQFIDRDNWQRADPEKSTLPIAEAVSAISQLHKYYPPNHDLIQFLSCDFSNIDFPFNMEMFCLNFASCNFNHSTIPRSTLRGVDFINCTFKNAILNYSDFARAGGRNCVFFRVNFSTLSISGIDFKNVEMDDVTGHDHARYNTVNPPFNLPVGTTLPTPFENGVHITLREAEDFWSQPGNDEHRPRDINGDLIKIVYPEDKEKNPNTNA